MPILNCVAIVISTGLVCAKATAHDQVRCRVHTTSFESKGPHKTARDELKARHRREIYDIYSNPGLTDEQQQINIAAITLLHNNQRNELHRTQREYVARHGNPDDVANIRARQRREQRVRVRDAWHAHEDNRIADIAPVFNPPVRELAAFAQDNQNVHTTHAVKQTKDIIKKILEIKVPVRYQWNKHECSKTPGHIIMQCKLTPTAAWQMTAKYCQAETIYEMGEGIYGRVLDCVWQFILASPDREDLMKIVKVEMQDNIGMCAQGNLSRLCNILSGYLDDVVIRESPAEIMGRMISSILETADITERARKMTEALIEAKMPIEKWNEWAEPAFDEKIVVINNRVEISA